MSAQVECIVIS